MADHSIDGRWRGHYAYHNVPDEGSGFEAIFTTDSNGLTGHILDDIWLGEATLTGSFSFPSVSFTKAYLNPKHAPIAYTGTMSADGKSINGTWTIEHQRASIRGSWTAYRLDEEEQKQQEHKQSKVKSKPVEVLH